MGIKFDDDAAMGADKGGFIKECGVYDLTIKGADIELGNDKATHVVFTFEGDSGEAVNFSKVCTRKKDGDRAYGYAMVQSLMGLLGIQELTIETRNVDGKDVQTMKEFVGKRVKVALQYEEYAKTSSGGGIGWKMSPIHFFDIKTGQTYSERKNNEPAKVVKAEIKPKLLPVGQTSTGGVYGPSGAGAPPPEDDFPF